jgi:predicted TIM-barrel fold metal-dependent hydrolase
MALREIGPDRFLFGTDYPYVISDPTYIEALDIPANQKQKILCENARLLFARRLDLAH